MKKGYFLAALLGGVAMLTLAWLVLGGTATALARPTAVADSHTITLTPIRDNTLYESDLGTISNGAGEFLFAGHTQKGEARRALLAFDLSGIPTGSIVLSATLTLTMSKSIAGDTAVAVHALTADWGEAASDALGEEGAGALALPGDATWLHGFFDTDLWATPGGDFAATASATTTVGGSGVYAWSSPALAADVAAWSADPANNFGWIVVGDESANGTAKRFDSRESAPVQRPRLVVVYAEPVGVVFVPMVGKN